MAEENIVIKNPLGQSVTYGEYDNILLTSSNGNQINYSKLPEVTTDDNGKVLGVVNGIWNKMEVDLSGVSGGGSGSGGGSVIQSDWNQDDETQLDYIKNRPFYDEEVSVTLLEESSRKFSYNSSFEAYISIDTNAPYTIIDDQEYVIVWDGTEYTKKAFIATNFNNYSAIGNPMINGGEDDGTPFGILYNARANYLYYVAIDTKTTHTINVSQNVKVPKQIDQKYIPLPFFGETEGVVYLIDGDYAYDVDGSFFVKIPITSDIHLTIGQTYTVIFDGIEYFCECYSYMGLPYVGDIAIVEGTGTSNGVPFVILEDVNNMFGFGFTYGMILANPPEENTSYSVKLSFNGVVTKKIDAKYLYQPDWNITDKTNSGYILNKPFGTYAAGTVWFDGSLTLFGENTDDKGNTIYGYAGLPNINIKPEDGHTLYLTVNGTEYTGVVTVDEYGYGSVTYTVDDKEFKISYEPEEDIIYVQTYISDLATITLTLGNDEIQKIPEYYLPPISASSLPEVTTDDTGKFLRVSSTGAWVAETVPNAEEASF